MRPPRARKSSAPSIARGKVLKKDQGAAWQLLRQRKNPSGTVADGASSAPRLVQSAPGGGPGAPNRRSKLQFPSNLALNLFCLGGWVQGKKEGGAEIGVWTEGPLTSPRSQPWPSLAWAARASPRPLASRKRLRAARPVEAAGGPGRPRLSPRRSRGSGAGGTAPGLF